ncbi:related to TLG2-member of the syntaxin family of t-SNAREs [Sporisorium reilianum SRZ2]|uniref:Related to TLG2-member of the syntaxin family of t-SNAREs n=1 Tax=Sporisorium reilianum (strain SRZ2) TaxID=999809 RepID=E6ZW36_SPORE|nr:related to TLG2-member of the syntaxin family of t-SNAREs [Sporisorium reilianum SRZ2]
MAAHYPLGSSPTPPPYAAGPSTGAGAFSTHLGQTRSRTLLFLSYRDSAGPSSRTRTTSGDIYFQAPYTDADDPLGSSALHASADTESQGLLSRRSREGHIALAVDSSSELPPKWMDVSDQVDALLAAIRPRMEQLARMHERHLRPGFADKSAEERHIEALVLDITKDLRRCSRLVAGLASFTQHLIREAKRSGGGDVTVRQIALAQNVQTALATRVQDLSGAFRKQQTLYLKRIKGMEVRDRDIRAARGLAPPAPSKDTESFRDSELAVAEDMELSRSLLSSNLLLEESATTSDREIAQRTREIDEIAKSIQELALLFTDLQNLVIDQGTMLDRIDYNVELMGREMHGAVQELETATRYQRRSGRRQCILFLCLLIAVLVAIIVVKPFWRGFASSSSVKAPQTLDQ